jgi:hypothetical protein
MVQWLRRAGELKINVLTLRLLFESRADRVRRMESGCPFKLSFVPFSS